jgi:hypothetical protein
MVHRSTFASAVVALAVLASPLALLAATVSAGNGLNGSLNNALDTKSSYAGQPISINVVQPFPQGISAFNYSVIYGHVGSVTPGGRGTNPQLSIILDKIKFSNGSSESIGAVVNKLEPKKDKRGRVLLGTAGGMALGNWAGKAMFGGSAGGAVGAATGFLLSSNNKSDFHVAAGSAVGMQLTRSLSVP